MLNWTVGDVLGVRQWNWLKSAIQNSPADFHCIVSSIQILTTNPIVESWGHFPVAKKRLFELLKDSDPPGLFFLSGDVHHGELSRVVIKRERSKEILNDGDNNNDNEINNDGEKEERDKDDKVEVEVEDEDEKEKVKVEMRQENNENSSGDKIRPGITGKRVDRRGEYEMDNKNKDEEVWVEVTSSGLTHTCGDSKINKILCPKMLKMFASHRLPNIQKKENEIENKNKIDEETVVEKENIFIGKNYGMITSPSSSSSTSSSTSSSSSSSTSSSSFLSSSSSSSSTPTSDPSSLTSNFSSSSLPSSSSEFLFLEISVMSIDTSEAVLTHTVRSSKHDKHCRSLHSNISIKSNEINRNHCYGKNPIKTLEISDFPIFIALEVADNLFQIVTTIILMCLFSILLYSNRKIIFY